MCTYRSLIQETLIIIENCIKSEVLKKNETGQLIDVYLESPTIDRSIETFELGVGKMLRAYYC